MVERPDFENRFKRAVLRQGEPDRVPLGDVTIDMTHKERFLGRPIKGPEDEIEFWAGAGFDFIPAEAGIQVSAVMDASKRKVKAQYALFDYAETERGWVEEQKGVIHDDAEFNEFPWPNVDDLDFSRFDRLSKVLPPGMRIMGALGKIFNSVWWFMGFQHFAEAVVENPDFVQRMFDKIAAIQLDVLDRILEYDEVGAVIHADDLGYSEALMISPRHLRRFLFPWYRELVERIHAKGKLAIFHSDGKIDAVMPDIIACGFDAVHPFEPKAMDIVEMKRLYGDRICLMGNIDLGYTLTRGTPDEVIAECRERLRVLAPGGGYCLASSNSIPEYVPYDNFLALLDTVYRYGRYPIEID